MRNETRIFKSMVERGGQINRAELSTVVFARNKSAAELDALLKGPLLLGLLVESRVRIRKGGRVSIRYTLTATGWQIARTWQLPIDADRIAPEETLRQFQILVTDGHPFASALSKDAATWRAHKEQEKQKREEKAALALEKKRERELNNPEPKQPSAGRHRSQEDLTQRARWFASKKAERVLTPVIAPTPHAPRPSFRDDSGVTRHGGGGFAQTPVTPLVMPQRFHNEQPHLDGATLALIRKISAAGYQHCIGADGRVLFNNTERLTPQEWIKRNPGVID